MLLITSPRLCWQWMATLDLALMSLHSQHNVLHTGECCHLDVCFIYTSFSTVVLSIYLIGLRVGFSRVHSKWFRSWSPSTFQWKLAQLWCFCAPHPYAISGPMLSLMLRPGSWLHTQGTIPIRRWNGLTSHPETVLAPAYSVHWKRSHAH